MGQLREIKARLDSLEANSPQGESGAVACSPAGEQVSLPRSPDRDTLSELKIQLEDTVRILKRSWWMRWVERKWVLKHMEIIIQWLDKLDRGPVAQCPSKVQFYDGNGNSVVK